MEDAYLTASSEIEIRAALAAASLLDAGGTAVPGVAIDFIGMVATTAYHVHVRGELGSEQLAALEPYRFQGTPLRSFAGALAVPTVDEQRAAKWLEIKAARDRRKAGGVQVGGYWFHSDDASRIQQIGLVMMGANIPAGLQWKTMSGEFVTMTPELAQQVFDAVATHDQAAFAMAEQHCAAMEVSDGPANYDYSAGWPPIYGE